MLFSWMPVPGTITPEPAPVEAVSEAALPRASTTAMWVVPGAPARFGDLDDRWRARYLASLGP
jgi:hypothetical protein